MAHAVLGRDPHVTIVDFDPTVIAKQTTECGSASCAAALTAACAWAVAQGVDYYATVAVATRYQSNYVCTKRGSGSIFDKHDPPCEEGHETDQRTTASFSLDVYDARSCALVPGLSQKLDTTAPGPEDESKPEALHELGLAAPAKSPGFPDQITVEASGRVAGEAVHDGLFALYRAGVYRGYVELRSTGTAAEQIRPLQCCFEPSAGDALVARGRRKYVDLALDGAVGSLTFDGTRRFAGGMGIHVRYYPIDAGFQFGFGADLIGNGNVDANVALFTPEIGYGIRPSPALRVSANLGAGFARATQAIPGMTDAIPAAFAGHVLATLRAQTHFATWWYVGGDAGYVLSGTFDSWDGTGFPLAKPMSVRSPIARIYAGFDL